ncbi:MAG: DNA polymerase/3'-5' exonuclease PolX [Planctomycetaceae bacterium]|nr:DNA polymerase/3'-5' exonuclease PolX [Planctomycetaceae bacterium]
MENAQVADMFDEIADLLDLQGEDAFRIRSYRNAARTLRNLSQRLEDMAAEGKDFADLPNIGKSTAAKVAEMLATGTCERLEALRAAVPSDLPVLMRLPGIGPRKAMQLHRQLGITAVEDLEAACREGRVRTLAGMGAKTEQKILEGLAMLGKSAGRILYTAAAGYAAALRRHLDRIGAISQWEIAGSFRRHSETVGDLDILVQARDRAKAAAAIIAFDEVDRVLARGPERVAVTLQGGLQVDFRFFNAEAFGAALMYFTGSKAHNIALRRRAIERGCKLNEYGLFEGDRAVAGATEEDVYKRLHLAWVPPELREDRGEIEAAAAGTLPKLIEPADVRGDLQSHTTATDGLHTVEEMAHAAADMGYQYLAITDHSKAIAMSHGLDEDALRRHAEHIRGVDATFKNLWVMAGVEVDILKDGQLDLDEKVLGEMDWVIAAVHSHFNLDEKAMTQRLLAAINSGVVHAIAHPLGRIIGRREPVAFDADKIFDACSRRGVRLEINAQPDRLDLPDTHCRRAREAGVGFTLGTDAHKIEDLHHMPQGVYVARRGWLSRADVLNTRTAAQLRKELKRKG